MMTIRETVKQALTTLPGNKPFDLAKLGAAIDILCSSDDEFVTYPQIKRAFRDIPYVRKLADGRYVVKGRRVPPKVDITQPPNDLALDRELYAKLAAEYECISCGTLSHSIKDGLCWRCQPAEIGH